jgi:two-component system, sensor histidine kinase LadS
MVLSEKAASVDLVHRGEYWIDTTGKLSPKDVSAQSAAGTMVWRRQPLHNIYPLLPEQALWVRFSVLHLSDTSHWLLEIPYAALNKATLFTLGANGGYQATHSGDLLANRQWSLPQRHTIMEMNTAIGVPTEYLLRIENAQGFSAPIRLVTTDTLLRAEQSLSLLLGAYFGVSFLGIVIGLIGLAWLRDSAYFLYAACAALIALAQAASTGLGSLYLWPGSPTWADRSLVVSGLLALTAFVLVNAKIVYLAQRSKVVNRMVWAMAAVGVCLCVAMFATASAWRIMLAVPFLFITAVLLVVINVCAWRHGDRFGLWLLISATPLFIAMAVVSARYLEWIALSYYTEQSWLASVAVQQILMLAALFWRSQQRRENARRIAGADRIDAATGLLNDHVFNTRLARMLARSRRFKYQSAVMLIEVTNSEQIRQDFGQKIADELPLLVASRLLSTAREIDTAARLSEQRFGMLVEGPLSAEEAATLGPRIVARCLMQYPGLHVDCVAQVRVAYALLPEVRTDSKPLLERLQDLLAWAPIHRTKTVFMLGETAPPPRRQPVRRPELF